MMWKNVKFQKAYVAMLEVNQKLKMMASVSFKPYKNTLLYNFTIQNVVQVI